MAHVVFDERARDRSASQQPEIRRDRQTSRTRRTNIHIINRWETTMRRITLLAGVLLLTTGATGAAQTRSLNVGDASINYDVSGRGPTVVFIHGWSHNISSWDDQVPAFK